MNVFELVAKLTLDTSGYEDGLKKSESQSSSFADKLKGGLATAGKVAAAGIAAAGAAAIALGKASLEGYADYEQLAGGIETLYKGIDGNTRAVDQMMQNASQAWKTAGMSANEYMSMAIESSAALINSLGGDTDKAAKMMDMAIVDMSDNVNKMGTSMESIQNAYRGFSRGNFTMLDNLALGFAGTKEGMEDLLKKAEEFSAKNGEVRDFSIDSYADIVEAIHLVQEEMGITGTTATEATKTISGSLNAMKSAWSNLVVGIADENANLDQLIDDFINSVVTAGENLAPRIEQIMQGLITLIQTAGEKLVPLLVEMIIKNLPQLVQAGIQLITTFAGALVQALPQLIAAIPQIIQGIVSGLQAGWPQIQSAGREIINQLGNTLRSLGSQALQWGKDLIQNFINGIRSKIAAVGEAVSSVAQKAASFLHFSEPDEGPLSNFHTYAPDMMKMFAKGIIDNGDLIDDAFNKTLGFAMPSASGVSSGISEAAGAAREIVFNVTEMIDGSVLARNQYRFNLEEADRHGGNLINAYA